MSKKRPDWVLVIAIFTFVTAGISLLTVFAAAMLPVPEIESGVVPLTLFDFVAAVVFALAGVVAAVYLLRLKKAAFYWFAVPLAAWVLLSLWDAMTKGVAESVTGQGIVSYIAYMAFGLVIGLAICVYSWGLIKKGVLQ